MTAKTVRDVLGEWLGDDGSVDSIVRDLREVLSSGPGHVPREIEARHLAAGDVIVAKDGALWMVSDVGAVENEVVVVSGGRVKAMTLAPDRLVTVLLTRTDARALEVLERELGAVTVAREVGA